MIVSSVSESSAMPDGIATMTHRRRHEPAYVVCGDASSRFYAAKWQLPAHRIRSECRMEHIVLGRRRGAAPIAKTVDGKAQRAYALPGAFTFIPSGEQAHYTVDGASQFLELYVAPELLAEFVQQHELNTASCFIRPVLAETDPWLAGYFQMLESEIELYRASLHRLDTLLVGQAQQLLLAHLVRSYSGIKRGKVERLERAPGALRPQVLRRVIEYIDANLTSDIRLADLARLAYVTERHFIRAFRAATGSTPYRYVTEKRLQACAQLLRTEPELSVATIASLMRFRSRSHFSSKFSERFGLTASLYRTHCSS